MYVAVVKVYRMKIKDLLILWELKFNNKASVDSHIGEGSPPIPP